MNQYSVILRAINNNGQKSDLEIVNVNDFLIDISAIEVGDIGKVFGISSQTFSLPGTDINNQFFNNVFDIGATPAVALNKSVPCQLLVDGEAVFTGKLYISDVISDDWNDVVYNCVVTNETVDFRVLTENQGLAELNWASYSHSYTYTSISQSWNDNLFSGSIFYPLINYGANPLNSQSPQFEFGGSKYQMDNIDTPLTVGQFKPAIQVKTIVDEIFNKINYKYTSSFINTDFFKNLYFLNSVDDKDGISFASAGSGSYVFNTVTQSVASGFTTLVPEQLVFNQEVYDTGNNFDLVFDDYLCTFTGTHILNFNIPFNITSNFGPLVRQNRGRQFIIYITDGPGVGSNVVKTIRVPLTNSTSGVVNTGNISVTLFDTHYYYFYFALQTPSSNGIEQFTTVVTAGQNGVYLKVQTPQNPEGGTVDISKIFGEIKTLDFMKGLIDKFNLVIEPLPNQQNILRIEPYNDWLNLGSTVDWTNIVDRSVKYKVEHPILQLPKKYKFSDDIDDDVLNQYQLDTYGKIYGEFNYLTDSDLANGDKQIGGFFAATPVKGLPVKGTNGTTVVPWLAKQEKDKYIQPFNFKPRLLHKQPVKFIPINEMYGTTQPGGGTFLSTYYYIKDNVSGSVEFLTYYRTLLATTESPTVFTSSLDLHYSNIGYSPFQQAAVNGQCQDGLYNRFWAFYINSLYDIDARLLTCNIVLDPSNIKDIKLNDKIFIDGHLYRINKISGANLVQQQSTEVELLKLPTRTQPFTGRRRVPTGPRAEDFEDVITNGFTDNGSVFYVNYETNNPVTNSAVLSYAATLDNYEAYGSEVNWNTQQPTNVNTNIIVLGNSKYNETQNNVIIVGSGNDIPDNLYGTSIFGDNNSINLTQPTSSLIAQNFEIANNVIMASSASIVDSNGIVLIQPSGSRQIVNSQNNVLLNPINNISGTDPTGSVYTGNLRNQGTADFKQGATMTGSVNITGSLTVNGVAITGATGSATTTVPFNFAFGTDPNNVTFVTITNPTGSNRAFTLKYNLTSGSVAINSGQLQVNTDGNASTGTDIIVQSNLTGAPTASFSSTFTGGVPPTLDIKASFIGTSYIISGSYNSFI